MKAVLRRHSPVATHCSQERDWCLIHVCCLPADAAGEPGGPLYYKEVLTRFYLEFFYPHDSERECDRTIGSSATKVRSPESS